MAAMAKGRGRHIACGPFLLQWEHGALTETHSLQGSLHCCFCLSLSKPCSATHFTAAMSNPEDAAQALPSALCTHAKQQQPP